MFLHLNVYVDITDEIGTLYTGPSIDVSCQVSVHLAKRFQMRRIKCDKLTDDGRLSPSDGKRSHGLWSSELKTKLIKPVL